MWNRTPQQLVWKGLMETTLSEGDGISTPWGQFKGGHKKGRFYMANTHQISFWIPASIY